ncbi:uncharacterized protein LOC131151452 [Malania oleifera]|uniref:uncharacterized protein LOC131151452 n=1 Tax=Malania oleifera TaxID=397392 RepID=UPI0025AE6120|nr:uncharacterized protein LOC131151452 [Malania oleifera]
MAQDCHAPPSDAPTPNQFRGHNWAPQEGYQRNTAQVQVYSLTLGDVEDTDNMVTGTISILSHRAIVLFDLGVTHSFVAREFVKLCGIEAQPLTVDLSVATPTGTVVVCRRVLKDFSISIQGRTLPANLRVLIMHRFEVILGMDWLTFGYASIDCYKKEVVFRPPREQEYRFLGLCVRASPPILSTMQVRRIHNVFHVSMLRKYVPDSLHVISYDILEVRDTLSYDEVPVQTLDWKEQELRTKKISLVKVLWRNHAVEEVSWELEEDIRQRYL